MTNEDLKARLRNDAHMIQCDGLSAMLKTAGEAADAIERLEAENAKLREAGNELGGYAGHDDSCACVKGWATGPCNCGYTDTWKQWTAALQETSHDRD